MMKTPPNFHLSSAASLFPRRLESCLWIVVSVSKCSEESMIPFSMESSNDFFVCVNKEIINLDFNKSEKMEPECQKMGIRFL
jgi:hypothetical protein